MIRKMSGRDLSSASSVSRLTVVRGCISRRDSLVTGQEGLVVYILYIVAANPEGSAGSAHPRVYIPSGCLRPPQD